MTLNSEIFTPYNSGQAFYQYQLVEGGLSVTVAGGNQVGAPGSQVPGNNSGGSTTPFSPTSNGLVPKPPTGTPSTYVLKADGTWGPGGGVLTCAAITALFPAGTAATSTTNLLSDACGSVSVASLPIAPSQLTAGALPPGITIPGSSITGALPAAAIPPITVTKFQYDAVGKNIILAVNGGADAILSVAALDDEAYSMNFSAGNLVIKNQAGTVLSTTPIPDLDAQTLNISGNSLSISGGNTITLPAVPGIFAGSATGTVPTATAADATKVLTGAGSWVALSTLTTSTPVFSGSVAGLVPVGGDATKFLNGVGAWVTVPIPSNFAGSAAGLVPTATAADAAKVLSGAGTWITPANPTTFAGSAAGLVPAATAADATKVLTGAGTWTALSTLTTSTPVFAGSVTGTVPAATAADATKVLSGAGTWITPANPTTFAGSAAGLVPAATAADAAKVLTGAGTWVVPSTPIVFAGSATGTVPAATAADATKVLVGAGTWKNVPMNEFVSICEFLNDELIYTRAGLVSFVVPTALANYKVTNIIAAVYTSAGGTVDVAVNQRNPGNASSTAALLGTANIGANGGSSSVNPTTATLAVGSLITVDATLTGAAPKGLTVTLTLTPP